MIQFADGGVSRLSKLMGLYSPYSGIVRFSYRTWTLAKRITLLTEIMLGPMQWGASS
jgi:hypothetical protein